MSLSQAIHHPHQDRAIARIKEATALLAEAVGLLGTCEASELFDHAEALRGLNIQLRDHLMGIAGVSGMSHETAMKLGGWVRGE